MKINARVGLACLAFAACGAAGPSPEEYDLVLQNGRVVDPESGLDAVRHVGILGGTIRAIDTRPLAGRAAIDARGLVVVPGFIDLHSHGQDPENYALKALDGVTSALELEVGTGEVDAWYEARRGKAAVHFGASIGHIPVRMAVMKDPPAFLPPSTSNAATRAASDSEVAEIKRRVDAGLRRGAVAVGFGIQYTPAASRTEILEVFRAAAPFAASCHVHMRFGADQEPGSSTEALEELIAASAVTGAPLHVVHIQSTGKKSTPRLLEMIDGARARGLDVSTECYPYTAGMTEISSAIFAEGWQRVLGVDYGQLQWAATGERLTKETFEKYRKTGGTVIAHAIPEEAMRAAVLHPGVMIASDGWVEKGKGHPRSSGTYAKILGRFVREEQKLTLPEAVRKMSLLPAQRLEQHVPMMRNKGRIRMGADADLVVFDAARVIDRSTYEEPARPSEGIVHVLVNGVPVVAGGKLREGVTPGREIRAPIRE